MGTLAHPRQTLHRLPMDDQTTQLIEAIHQTPYQIVFVAAGAGAQAVAHLLSVAGASRTLLEAVIPYSKPSFNQFIGQTPEKYVTRTTACLLAGNAYQRARQLQSSNQPCLGIACTATISTDRLKRGQHRAHIAIWQPEQLHSYDLFLHKGLRERGGEEALISNIMLNYLGQAMGLTAVSPQLAPKDQLLTTHYLYDDYVNNLLEGRFPAFGIGNDGRPQQTPPAALLSGSFNPLHQGHIQLAEVAAKQLNTPVAFECTAVNADKPTLPKQTILQRMAQFAGRWPVWVSNAATFAEKSALYPGTTFVIGYDTAERILQTRFYHHSYQQMLAALEQIRANGCAFLVAGRQTANNQFRHLTDLPLPHGFADLFQAIPASEFNVDISSTQLRQSQQQLN